MSEPAGSGVPRARAKSSRALTDERIMDIAEEMASGRWRGGESDHEWAGRWGLSPTTVANMAVEASRLTRLVARDRARLRIASSLDRTMDLLDDEVEAAVAGAGRCDVCGRSNLDATARVAAVHDRYAKLTGADEARPDTVVNVGVQVLVQSIAALPAPQQVEALRELTARGLAEFPPAEQERRRALLAEAFAATAAPEEEP